MATPRKDPRNPIRLHEDIRSHKFRRILTEDWLTPRWTGQTPICEIAQEAGCCTSTILRYVSWFNLPPRPRQKTQQGWEDVLTGEYLEAAYVEAHMSTEAIAAEVGTTSSTVNRWLIAYGIPRRGHEPGIDNLLYEDLLTPEFLERRLRERISVNDIAREVGCTSPAVKLAIAKHGLTKRTATVRPPDPPCATPEQLRALYESGLGLEAIGVRLGVSRTKVRSDLSRFGIRPYSRPGFRLTDGAWAKATGSGSLAEKAPPPGSSPRIPRPPARLPVKSIPSDCEVASCDWESLTEDDRRALLVLADHDVKDKSGHALAHLQRDMAVDSRRTVRVAMMRLEGLGLAERERSASRTYRVSITAAGTACVDQGRQEGTPAEPVPVR